MKSALVVFVKAPVPGKVKTRLSPPLKPEESAQLYTAFLKDSYSQYTQLKDVDLFYFYSGDIALLNALLPKQEYWEKQSDGDLGDRIISAFNSILRRYKKCVIVGSDHPDLPLSYLKKAFSVLDYVDVSVGPSDDGGYYCIGLKKVYPSLFTQMEWSVNTVFLETQRRISQEDLESFTLPEWYDIDTITDLKRFSKNYIKSVFPNTAKELSELSL